jgi:hypothetical protein
MITDADAQQALTLSCRELLGIFSYYDAKENKCVCTKSDDPSLPDMVVKDGQCTFDETPIPESSFKSKAKSATKLNSSTTATIDTIEEIQPMSTPFLKEHLEDITPVKKIEAKLPFYKRWFGWFRTLID